MSPRRFRIFVDLDNKPRSRNQMPLLIPYRSEDFPPSYGIRSGILTTSWDEILWAAVTIGRPNFVYVFRHGKASIYEAHFRMSLIRMAIEQDNSGKLTRTDAFAELDPTEKGAINYFLGMTFCKLFASKLLDTHWLVHLDVFRNSLNPTLLGRSRPDLVGNDKFGKQYSFESKGRSNPPSLKDIKKAKLQAQRLVSVDRKPCSLQIGAFSYFKSGILHFHWCDPEAKGNLMELVSPEYKWRYYYEPVLALAANSEASIPDVCNIQIHTEIHRLLSRGLWDDAYVLANELRDEFKEFGFQPDGIRIEASESWQHPFKGRFEF